MRVRAACAAALCATLAQSQQCSFPIDLNGTQCYGLALQAGISSATACASACCAQARCEMWEWCYAAGKPCSGEAGCWMGSADLNKCASGPGWVGGARNVTPPALLPQQYATPVASALLLAVLDLSTPADAPDAWSLQVDSAQPRSVLVPGGGYNSDQQPVTPWIDAYASVQDHATYTTALPLASLPPAALLPGVAVTLAFGAVNYGAEVCVDGSLYGVHYGPLMPFEVDVTPAVVAAASTGGSAAVLNVTIVSRPFAYLQPHVPSGFRYAETWQQPSNGWSARFPNGISKWVQLRVHAPIRATALTVQPDVSALVLRVNMTIAATATADTTGLVVSGALSSWNSASPPWQYPTIPPTPVTLAPGGNATVSWTIPWAMGPASWWWPNIPFSETYLAQLHWLNVTATVSGSGNIALAAQRFGFVQHAEGPYYYMLNGLRINQLSDATPEAGMSWYDAYASPAFLPSPAPVGAATGAHESWRRYMRLGITSNRIHQSTPTQVMLDAADEVGFLLKPETPVRGCGDGGYEPCSVDPIITAQPITELIAACRNHPSVVAYSIENESQEDFIVPLIDAAAATLPGVPLTTEGSGGAPWYNGSAAGLPGAHAFNMLHYAVPPAGKPYIQGVGECAWCVSNGLEYYSSLALAGRLADVAYYAGWDMLNYWPNFLQNMNASRHAWHQEPCNGTDRVDGVDGWGSPVVEWVQAAFHRYGVVDTRAVSLNPIFNSSAPTPWPYVTDTYTYNTANPGASGVIQRLYVLFNDVLRGDCEPWDASPAASGALLFNYTALWDDPVNGTIVVSNSGQPLVLPVQPGFHVSANATFPIPDPGAAAPPEGRRLYITASSSRPATALGVSGVMYTEDRVFVLVNRG